uniref:Uncharacterized protein n=1 Tax=Romanomermis culicivorax TaxID=13658 RepID=A0A915LAG7_ROMCU
MPLKIQNALDFVGHPVDGKSHWEIAMQIKELDNKWYRHFCIEIYLINGSKGPKAQAPTCSQQALENPPGDPF